ncbi:MAG: leucine-rich repeat domain-containing protein [Verrucomicrobiota bacterium]
MIPLSKIQQIARSLLGLTAIIASCGLANEVSAAQSGDFTYTVKDSEVTITGFPVDFKGAVVIPAQIAGNPVKKIGDHAFYFCGDVTGITIPAGVTHIGNEAFSDCSKLTNLTLPSGLKGIGTRAFSHTDLRRVTIPGGVKTLSAEAFVGCFRLNEVEISNGVKVIGEQAFGYCSELETVTLPTSVNEVTIATFSDSSLKSINVASGNREYASVDGILYNKNRTKLISCPTLKSGNVKIPAGVKRLDEKSFYACRSLKSVELPKGLVAIEARAFSECSYLEQADIPPGVTEIGHHAFSATAVSDVVIPASVDRMGGFVFVRCRNMKRVYFKGDAPSAMGPGVFDSTAKSGVPVDGFMVFFYEGKEGFTEPTWLGYDTVAIDPDMPAANRLVFGFQWRN